MSWNEDQALCFECHSKPNFQYKYLNKVSFHTSNCKIAVSRSVAIRLASLTTRTEENDNKSLSELYPINHKALQAVGLLSEKGQLPSLGKVLDGREQEQAATSQKKEERKKDKRNTYNLTRYSGN